jgi:hypothetical protein
VLGNYDLQASSDQGWRNRKAEWHLIGDLATTVDAFILLEQQHGAPHVDTKRSVESIENRLAAGCVARFASWRGTDPSPDLAFAAPEVTLGALGGPRSHLVRQPEDYVLAQQALAGFLRPRLKDLDDIAGIDRPGLLAARTVAAGQIRLATAFAGWAEREYEPELAQRFRAWIPLYADLHRSTLRLTEVQRTSSPLIVAQQSEAVRQLCRHQDARLDFRTMRALDRGTRVVAVATGKARRREVQTRRFVSAPHGLLPRACPPVPVPGARPGGQSVQPSATPRLTHSPIPVPRLDEYARWMALASVDTVRANQAVHGLDLESAGRRVARIAGPQVLRPISGAPVGHRSHGMTSI